MGFLGRNDAKAETSVLWPPHAESWLIGKDSDAGRDWGQEEKGTTEDEMAGWHHRLDEWESGWTPGVVDGQGGLACCDSWGCKESDTTERLNWTEWTDGLKISLCIEKCISLFIYAFNASVCHPATENNQDIFLSWFLYYCLLLLSTSFGKSIQFQN